MPYSFPSGYNESKCFLVPIRAALVPFVAGVLRQLEAREAWETETDYEQGYNAIAELEACMVRTCVDELLDSNDRLYRLLDSALYGRQYQIDYDPGDPNIFAINPHIPDVPYSTITLPGLLARAERIEHVLDNALNGTFYPEYPSNTAMRNQLARIIELLEQGGGELDDDMLEQLKLIVAALA